MSTLEAVILGIVQGLTEFLPISSSGHLVLAKSILGVDHRGIAFEIFVHFGSLLAVITVYRRDLVQICTNLWRRAFRTAPEPVGQAERDNPNGSQLFLMLVIGSLPAAVIGLTFRSVFERAFSSTAFVSSALIFTAIILFLTRLARDRARSLNPGRSLLIGLAQVVAFFPGVSRAGTTIGAGLLLGVSPAESARYSFLLAVPLILGVTAIKSFELIQAPPSAGQLWAFGVGGAAAYFASLWAIKWLVMVLQKGRFDRFAYYCLAVGIFGLVASSMQ